MSNGVNKCNRKKTANIVSLKLNISVADVFVINSTFGNLYPVH